ncbi:unnamed protein product [Bursaphelenchus okinawaensis]|uniref:Uncharacterized protein n=1 Tax=Bursaphelenchus okinawaensis TaxID=465554 RepID=A0A811LMQ2_9BILA|nr:unnamed protein product [Bursaphelenchus okinawaensis]CAG9128187.1 unnamed protein product [Bursaphelenchus okinawaensis]
MVAFLFSLVCIGIVSAHDEVTSLLADLIERPVNRIENTAEFCVDLQKRHIPNANCTVLFISMADKEYAWAQQNEMSSFIQSLPNSVKNQTAKQVTTFTENLPPKCNQTLEVDFYCLIQLISVVYMSPQEDSSIAVCSPCRSTSHVLQALLTSPKEVYFEATGKTNFEFYRYQYFDHPYEMAVNYSKDEVLLQSSADQFNGHETKYYGIEMKFTLLPLESDRYQVELNYSMTKSDQKKYDCDQNEKEMYFDQLLGNTVTISCYFDRTKNVPMLTLPQRIQSFHMGFVNCTYDPSKTCLSDVVAYYLAYCERTFSIVPYNRTNGFMCSAYYNKNGVAIDDVMNAVTVIDGAPILEPYSNSSDIKCTLQFIEFMHTTQSSSHDIYAKRYVRLGCSCYFGYNGICDHDMSPNMTQEQMDSIPATKCYTTRQDEQKAEVDGYYGYCAANTTADGYYHYKAIDTEISNTDACYRINHGRLAICVLIDGTCQCCCKAVSARRCNDEFKEGGLYYNESVNCENDKKFGPFQIQYPNIQSFPDYWPYSSRRFISLSDLRDTNREYEKLYGYFVLDVRTLLIDYLGIYNQVRHSQSHRDEDTLTRTERLANTQCNNIGKWRLSQMTSRSKCFTLSRWTLLCCTGKQEMYEILVDLTNVILEELQIERFRALSYRETSWIDKDIVQSEDEIKDEISDKGDGKGG